MLNIIYSERFISEFERLDKKTRDIALKKIEIFRQNYKHPSLKTHKLNGQLSGFFSFSVDVKMRIVFEYSKNQTVNFLKIGGHEIYR